MLLNRVRIVTTGVAGSPAYMNLYSQQSLASPAAAHAAAAAFANGFKTQQVSTAVNTVEPDVAVIDTFNDNIIGVTSVPQVTYSGTGSASLLPPSNQGLVRWLTGSYAGGRQIRGRTFIPYLQAGAASGGGIPTAGFITAINGAVNAYLAAMPVGSAVVYSRKNTSGFPVTSFSVWTQFAVMRSRRD